MKIFHIQITTALISALSNLLVFFTFSTSVYGRLAIFLSFSSILLSIIGTRNSEVLSFFLASDADGNNHNYLPVSFLVEILSFFLLLLLVAFVFFVPSLFPLLEELPQSYAPFVISLILIYATSSIFRSTSLGIFIAFGNVHLIYIASLVESSARLFLTLIIVLFAYFSHQSLPESCIIPLLILTYSASSLACLVFLIFKNKSYYLHLLSCFPLLLTNKFREILYLQFNLYRRRLLMGFSASSLSAISANSEVFFLSFLVPPQYIGFISLFKQIFSFLHYIVSPLSYQAIKHFSELPMITPSQMRTYVKDCMQPRLRYIYISALLSFFFSISISDLKEFSLLYSLPLAIAICLSTFIEALMWYVRPFSLAYSQRISIILNLTLSLSFLAVVCISNELSLPTILTVSLAILLSRLIIYLTSQYLIATRLVAS